jgi:Domain of unknown function (DUF5666)
MQMQIVREKNGINRGKVIWKMYTAVALFVIAFSITSGQALSEEEDGEGHHAGSYESKIYGTVERLPEGKIGTWVINKRDVLVTKETRIMERHGKAIQGAYVEAEGKNMGKTFEAAKIEVKRSKHP